MSGASPDVMAATVAAPLERHLGFIADVTEMTSRSSLGQTMIILQFSLDRDIDGAARDVEAAINAARADLPSNLRSNPTYRKYNPSDAPILLVALTSATRTAGQLYDTAATVLQQKLSQIEGVGNVDVGGSSLPAVRVELNPDALSHYGIGLEDVRAALAAANANSPKGAIDVGDNQFQVYTNDQATHAADYRDLVVAYRSGRATLLSDIAEVNDSVQSLRYAGSINGKPAVTLVVYQATRCERNPDRGPHQSDPAFLKGFAAWWYRHDHHRRSNRDDSHLPGGYRADAGSCGRASHFSCAGIFARLPGDANPGRDGADLDYRDVLRHVSPRLFLKQSFVDGVDHSDRVCGG